MNTVNDETDNIFNQTNNLEKKSRGERRTMKTLENFGFKITNKILKVKIGKKDKFG